MTTYLNEILHIWKGHCSDWLTSVMEDVGS